MNMKKNVWYVMLLMAAMFAGCAAERDGQNAAVNNSKASVNPDSIPVAFDAYQNRTISRSGWAGVLDNDQLKETKANGGGFGVFAYYTDLKNYDQSYVPNFMYNRGVFYNGADGTSGTNVWEYTPIAYWPNEYGFDAASDDEDHLSFFAYAPYTQHTSAAAGSVADATYGIVGFSRNTATGDPMVRYIASFDPEKSVDLCWGVVPADKTDWPKIQGGGSQTLAAGFPYLNMERPLETATQTGASSASRIKFKFNHALAQLNVQIDTDADITTHADSGDELDDATKVYVRSISFTGIALQGALNLNNSVKDQALWLDWCGCTDLAYGQSVTVHDGRRDSREGAAGAEAANETPTGLNPNIIQNSYATDGVTHEYQNLFNPTSTDPADQLNDAICVIPTGESMTITIVYDIETENPKLAGYLSDGTTHGLSIENRVTKTITFGGVAGAGLESNKRYALKLHLGMNSVKFDAEVSDWATNTVNGEGWLPSNVRPITLSQTVMYLGAAQTLTATTDPTGRAVSWNNSDNTYVDMTATTSSTRGGTRAEQDITSGTTTAVQLSPVALTGSNPITITATRTDTGDKATCLVHVVPVTVSSSYTTGAVTKTKAPGIAIKDTISLNTTATLTATMFGSATGNLTWTTSNSSIVSLGTPSGTNNGTCVVTAAASGEATITVTHPGGVSDGAATITITVTEKKPTVNSVPTLHDDWTYDTSTKDLITAAGSITNGTMYYMFTKTNSAPSANDTSWKSTYNDVSLQATNAGDYYVWYKVVGATGYSDIAPTKVGKVAVDKATPTLTLSSYSGTTKVAGRDAIDNITITNTGDGSLSASSDDTSIAKGSISGTTLTVKGVDKSGTATITVTLGATTNYKEVTADFDVTVNALSKDLNALSFVTEYNVCYDGSSTFSFGSSDNQAYFFSWYDAMRYFTISSNSSASDGAISDYSAYTTGSGSKISGYHMPVRGEWLSIAPTTSTNIWSLSGSESISGVIWGCDATTKAGITDNSYWVRSGNEMRAIRFLGTDYCSAWKYTYSGSTLTVSATLIEKTAIADAATWYSNNWASVNFSNECGVTRNFYALGDRLDGNYSGSSADSSIGNVTHFWSTTLSGVKAYNFRIDASDIEVYEDTNARGCGFPVRLFKDN